MPETRDDRPTVIAASLELHILSGLEIGRSIPIGQTPIALGRGGRSGVVLLDPDDPPALSREHATISVRGSRLVLTDHSTNGTSVGDRWLARGETSEIRPGDRIRLGPSLILEIRPAVYQGIQTKAKENQEQAVPPIAVHRPKRNLREVITDPATLREAWHRVELNRGAAGPDNVSIHEFSLDADRRLDALRRLLLRGRYEPLPPRLVAIPKRSGGVRTIAILSIQDRIVQQAVHTALMPVIEPDLPPCSYAYRPGVCAHHALRAVEQFLSQGLVWVAETDIESFFDTISHKLLLDKLAAPVTDQFTLTLISRCLAAGCTEPGRGLPQGAATSPLFSNLHLADFDRHMLESGWNPIRYGDDMLFLCDSRGHAQQALSEAEGFLRSRLQLALKPEKTAVRMLDAGFSFLGFRFDKAGRRPSPRAISSLKERLENASPAQAPSVLRGWRNYFGDREATDQTQTVAEIASSSPETPASSDADDQAVDRFLSLFSGREGVYARQTAAKGRLVFTPCSGSLSPELVRNHLAGSVTLASYFVRSDETVKATVLDLDAERGTPADAVRGAALDILSVCGSVGLPTTLEFSGRKGYHVWLLFSEPVPVASARRLGRLIAASASFPREGMRLEVLPRQSDWPGPDLGDAVKLPLGVHPVTGQRCSVMDAHGDPVPDVEKALEMIRTISAAEVPEITRRLSQRDSHSPTGRAPIPDTGGNLSTVVEGCTVISALASKARDAGHLRHTYRLILLYTLGRLGTDGASFIHRTLSLCRNYDQRICQKHLDRLDPTHSPITCARIREWLEEDGETGLCSCGRPIHSPVDLATTVESEGPKRKMRKPPPPPQKRSEEDAALLNEVMSDVLSPLDTDDEPEQEG